MRFKIDSKSIIYEGIGRAVCDELDIQYGDKFVIETNGNKVSITKYEEDQKITSFVDDLLNE